MKCTHCTGTVMFYDGELTCINCARRFTEIVADGVHKLVELVFEGAIEPTPTKSAPRLPRVRNRKKKAASVRDESHRKSW